MKTRVFATAVFLVIACFGVREGCHLRAEKNLKSRIGELEMTVKQQSNKIVETEAKNRLLRLNAEIVDEFHENARATIKQREDAAESIEKTMDANEESRLWFNQALPRALRGAVGDVLRNGQNGSCDAD